MRILLCHNHYVVRGGESEVFENEVRGLRGMGHEVVVYTRRNSEIAQFATLRRLALALSAFHSARTQADLDRLIFRRHPDFAIVQNVFPLISPSAYTAITAARIPIIQAVYNYRFVCPSAELYTEGSICQRCVAGNTVHAVIHRCYRNSYAQSSWYAAIIGSHRFLGTFAKGIDSFMVPDNFLGSKLILGGIPASKIWRNPNPFFVQDYIPTHHHQGFALFVGRLVPQKGLLTLVEAVARSANTRLVIVGEGPLRAPLEDRIKSGRLEGRIRLMRPQWGNRLSELLSQCAVVVIPSEWYDNLPLILCKANAAGKPVIASRLDGLPEYIEEGQNGALFEAGDPASLSAQLTHILALSTRAYASVSASARGFAERRLDYGVHYANLLSVVSGLGNPKTLSGHGLY